MSEIIIAREQRIKDILEKKPLLKDPAKEAKALSKELDALDHQIRIAQFDLRHGDFETVANAQKQFSKLQAEYSQKSERCADLNIYLETVGDFSVLKQLNENKKLVASVGGGFGSVDHFQQQQYFNKDLEFEISFPCGKGHKRKFKLLDMLTLTALRTLVRSVPCEVGLGTISCEKCRRNNTFSAYVRRIA